MIEFVIRSTGRHFFIYLTNRSGGLIWVAKYILRIPAP